MFNTGWIGNLYQDPMLKAESSFYTTLINIGSGITSIKELAETIKEIIEFKGELVFNRKKYDYRMRKLTDVTKNRII